MPVGAVETIEQSPRERALAVADRTEDADELAARYLEVDLERERRAAFFVCGRPRERADCVDGQLLVEQRFDAALAQRQTQDLRHAAESVKSVGDLRESVRVDAAQTRLADR